MFESFPERAVVYEVGPRDGLQNEAAQIPTERKLALIAALAKAGLQRIEVTSFVSPRWIPQLADAEQVVAALPRSPEVVYSALVPNEQGLQRSIDAGLSEAAFFLSSSESHSKKNINKSVAEAVALYTKLAKKALAAGLKVRAYVSTVWGCPYEGEVPLERSVELARRMVDLGCYQVSLGDTIGVGTPVQTRAVLEGMLARLPAAQLAMHMHDTRGTALANVLVGLSMGITTFDASVGGLGGCPYAPGAAGNLATEDLVYMLQGMGIETGVDLELLVEAGQLAQEAVGRELPGKYLKAASGARQKKAVPGQT